eukprot:XP_011668505.1 PREDICTED: contactin-1 [Strongylocentrotus purpuratus]
MQSLKSSQDSSNTQLRRVKMFYKIVLSCVALFGAAVHAETGPILMQQPEETIFDTASNVVSVSFHCRATGDEPITYTWTKDGAPLSLATNARLVITPGQLTITSPERTVDGGEYVCMASNRVGSVRSLPAELVFAYVDLFDPSATSTQSLTAGQGGCVTCNPPPHYPGILVNWFHENSLVDSSDSRIRVMYDGRLCFFYALASDAGAYRCQVKSNVLSEGGVHMRVSPLVTVTVNAGSSSSAIRIVQENRPTDVMTIAGEDVKFECFFYGPQPTGQIPRVQWVRTSPPGAGLPTSRAVLEEGGEILSIVGVQLEDAGSYLCYIDDVNSGASAGLNVAETPTWVSEPLDAMKDINTMQEWNVEAEEAAQYTWYRNGEMLTARDRHQFRNNHETLIISDLITTDTAMYQCFASNNHGMIYSAAQLSVRAFPPMFLSPMETEQPAPLTATVTVLCDVDAAPAPTVTWQHDGQPITGGARYNLTADPPNLVIIGVRVSDGGTYQCTATNSNGTVTGEGSLDIKDSTVITGHPYNTLVEVGQSTTLRCKAAHDESLTLTYLWEHNGVEIDLSEIDRYRMSERDRGNLEIVSAQLRDGGEYTCVALTVADSDRSSATLDIAAPPGPPSGLSVEVENLAANLSWVPGTDNNSPITSFTIEGQTDHSDEWVELPSGESTGSNSVRLIDLDPFSLYSFRVIAVNRIGRGTPSEPVEADVKTGKTAPTASPSNVGGGGGNTGDLRITWDKFPTSKWNSETVSYKVEWQKVDSRVSSIGLLEEPNAIIYTATLGIDLYTQYRVRIQARNGEGEGPFSEWAVIYSYQEGYPSSAIRIVQENRPTDVTTIAGEDVKFECFFYGPQPTGQIPRVQWVRTSPPGAGLPTSRAVLEEGGEVLSIVGVQLEDAGSYLCYINDVYSGASAGLNVAEAPTWVSEPLDAMKDINTMQEWNVEAEEAAQYTWYRNGEILTARDRHQFRNNLETLIISDLKTTDTAMYQCFASNNHGMIYSAAQLSVRAFPPMFLSPMETEQPAPITATVTALCDVDAAPAPTVTWQHDGQPITNSARYNLTADPPNLVIIGVRVSDGGTYQCTATNSNGTVTGEGSLDIKDSTVITGHPDNTLVEVGQSTTLRCKAAHDESLTLTYLWKHNGVAIDLSEIDRYRMSERDNGNLEIVSAQSRDGGEYTCVALTVADSDRSSATLDIAGQCVPQIPFILFTTVHQTPPGPPSGLSVEVENLAANLSWVPGTDNNSPITSFTIEGQTDHSDEWVELRSELQHLKLLIQAESRKVYWSHLESIYTADGPNEYEGMKRFWKFVKNHHTERCGIPIL